MVSLDASQLAASQLHALSSQLHALSSNYVGISLVTGSRNGIRIRLTRIPSQDSCKKVC